jgi:hypothetical protein
MGGDKLIADQPLTLWTVHRNHLLSENKKALGRKNSPKGFDDSPGLRAI